MKPRNPRAKKTATASRRPHQRLRHRAVLPTVPREDRDDAISAIRERHGPHATALLLLARSGVVTARRVDSLLRFIDWAFALRDAVNDLRWPRPAPGGLKISDGVEFTTLVENARRVQKVVEAQARLADTLTAFRDKHDETELLRDVDIMMGAVVARYAAEQGIPLDHRDLALLAVAVGIELPGDDPKTAWNRWYKRMPKVKAATLNIRRCETPPHEI